MTDWIQLIGGLDFPILARCSIPKYPAEVTDRGHEDPPREAGTTRESVEKIWRRVEALYQSGVHPAIQLCVRRRGAVVLNRAIGHARGNAPNDPKGATRIPITTATPINLFSAAKAVTAMVIHKLDEQRVLHLEDRVAEFVPEFARYGKDKITLRHVVSHRSGIPTLPPEAIDLDLLSDPDRMLEIICDLEPVSAPGRLLAYHAISGGFVLAEVVRRATGLSIAEVLAKEVREPLGLDWFHFGVSPADVPNVALNAVTGPPPPPPISGLLRRALGVEFHKAVDLSNDPRFITGVIPSANLFTTAEDCAAFYQCLLNEGELDGVRIFDRRTIHHATDRQGVLEIDLTLGMPIAYGNGFMLGNDSLSLFGWQHPNAFGHLGLSNVICWADPDRELAVALLTTGKPIVSLHTVRLAQLVSEIHEAFPVRHQSLRGR